MMEAVLAFLAIMAIGYQRFGELTRNYSRRCRLTLAIVPAVGIVLVCVAVGVGVGVTRAAAGRNTVNPVAAFEQTLWKTGDLDILAFRIPLLTFTPRGYLIAAVEARKHMADAGPKYLTVRRSKDKGKTWGPPKSILNNGYLIKDGFMLGSILVDYVTNTTFIVYLQCGSAPPHVGCPYPAVHIINSTNDGTTWGKPRNLTDQISHVTFAPGPGYGIQKQREPHKGRLIVCGHRSTRGTFCILSDDHGMTWRYGKQGIASLPSRQERQYGDFQPDECQLVELPNGSIMLNARNEQKYRCRCRIISISHDGADTFPVEDITFDEALVDPTVAAGLLYHDSVLYFTNPKNATHRMSLTLQWSSSQGKHWDGEYKIWEKQSGYSTIAAEPHSPAGKDYIYILFEKGVHREYESISFVKVKVKG